MNNQKVYTAMHGEPAEGGSIIGIYSSRESAEEAIERYKKEEPYTSWHWFAVEEWEVEL
jgi:hypothetical protein